ncbi:tRNA-cytidine(32) 2-sulfurtransferase [Trichonephila clavipes]|nr:tRNA-cytidine(32) 2-sulfurtransferase [Trichonephila clavipes]
MLKKLPVIPENCPACFEAPKERHRMKQLLAAQEIQFPNLYLSLKTAMYPLMAINLTGVENKILGKNALLNFEALKDDEEN